MKLSLTRRQLNEIFEIAALSELVETSGTRESPREEPEEEGEAADPPNQPADLEDLPEGLEVCEWQGKVNEVVRDGENYKTLSRGFVNIFGTSTSEVSRGTSRGRTASKTKAAENMSAALDRDISASTLVKVCEERIPREGSSYGTVRSDSLSGSDFDVYAVWSMPAVEAADPVEVDQAPSPRDDSAPTPPSQGGQGPRSTSQPSQRGSETPREQPDRPAASPEAVVQIQAGDGRTALYLGVNISLNRAKQLVVKNNEMEYVYQLRRGSVINPTGPLRANVAIDWIKIFPNQTNPQVEIKTGSSSDTVAFTQAEMEGQLSRIGDEEISQIIDVPTLGQTNVGFVKIRQTRLIS